MKQSDKIGYITFWINIVALFIWFSIIPVSIIFPGLFEKVLANNGVNPISITLYIIFLGAAFHWSYCIWFLLKFDRYSFSIVPLFFLNALYAPIYFYRVKIKGRPLRNKIKIEKDNRLTVNIISEEE